jgi:hypothetical protein
MASAQSSKAPSSYPKKPRTKKAIRHADGPLNTKENCEITIPHRVSSSSSFLCFVPPQDPEVAKKQFRLPAQRELKAAPATKNFCLSFDLAFKHTPLYR